MKNLVDTHLHLYSELYEENRQIIIDDMKDKLDFAVNISCDMESTLESIEFAEKYEFMYATVGYHPCDISKYNEADMNKMLDFAVNHPKVVAIGEIGLDYYWMNDPKEEQEKYFRLQIEKAIEVDKPIVVHTRDALEDTIRIINEYPKVRGILHCYPGTFEMIEHLLDRFYIGIGGTVTFKNNKITHELVKKISIDKIVLETDSPYLTPVPFRGKLNNPTYVSYVAEKIAELKEMKVEEVKIKTTENAMKVYNVCIK
ncbi:TatD family hydrolase [Streptobacillus canis]|uniref:TatD family hydrolase n=1 Tax=Streptobacillus canis TaxID=2678686 RepID=UPI0012E1ED0A|nr:TatD family hydrolase [Streptobacillus canis]